MNCRSSMRASLCVLLCIVAAMLLAPPVAATSAIYLDNASQSSQSDAVVLATVESIRPAIHPRWKRPLVMTRIRVDEILVGEAPRHLEIEQFGGNLDGRVTYVPGDANLVPGERCALFLRHRDGRWFLTAMEQSKFILVETAGALLLERNLGVQLFRRAPDGSLEETHPPRSKWTLPEFQKSLVQKPGVKK